MKSKPEAPPTVAEILRESGARPADLHKVAPGLSVSTLDHIARGTSSGITKATPLAHALADLAEARRRQARTYVEAAALLRSTRPVKRTPSPNFVGPVLRSLDVAPHQLQRANPEHLNIHTLHAILRKGGKGRISGTAQAPAIADALSTLAQEAREEAERYEGAAERLHVHYPDRRVFKTVPEPGETDTDKHIIVLAKSGEKLAAIGRTFGISRQRVKDKVTAYEQRTGERIQRHGKPYKPAVAVTHKRFSGMRLKDAIASVLSEGGELTTPEIVTALQAGGFKATLNLNSNAYRALGRMVKAGEVERDGNSYRLATTRKEGAQ